MAKRYCLCGAAKVDHQVLCTDCWNQLPVAIRREWWEFPCHRHRRVILRQMRRFLLARSKQRSFLTA